MRKVLFILIFGMFVSSCNFSEKTKSSSNQELALAKAFAESSYYQKNPDDSSKRLDLKRKLKLNFNQLRSFEIISFPLISGIENKGSAVFDLSKIPDSEMSKAQKMAVYNALKTYGRPISFRVHAVELQTCYKLIKNRPQHKPEKFFGKAGLYKQKKKKVCMVLEMKRSSLVKKQWLRKDDIVAVRAYLDDDFRPYGKSVDYYNPQTRSVRTVDYRYGNDVSMSSELSSYPMDVPNFTLQYLVHGFKKLRGTQLNIPNQNYIHSRLKKLNVSTRCKSSSLYRLGYNDLFDNKVEVNWCEGHTWPTTIQTNRFFSILRKI